MAGLRQRQWKLELKYQKLRENILFTVLYVKKYQHWSFYQLNVSNCAVHFQLNQYYMYWYQIYICVSNEIENNSSRNESWSRDYAEGNVNESHFSSYKVTLDMGGINCSRRVNQSVIRAGLIHCVTRLTFWKFFCRFCCHEYPRLNQSNCHPFKMKLCVINHMIMPLYTYACGTNMTTIAIHDPRDEINNISQSNLDNLI